MRATTVTLLSVSTLLACAIALAGSVYKWVDENGVTHYSDQPHPSAQTVELQSAQTYQGAETAAPATGAQPATGAPGPAYATCELYRPEPEEVFLNTDTVTAKLRLEPILRRGDKVAIGLDGKRLTNQPTGGSEFVLTQVERGEHSVFAVIEDPAGKEVCRSAAIRFYVRQPSKLAPNRQNRPRF
jgi:hypothetical protein